MAHCTGPDNLEGRQICKKPSTLHSYYLDFAIYIFIRVYTSSKQEKKSDDSFDRIDPQFICFGYYKVNLYLFYFEFLIKIFGLLGLIFIF